MENPGNTLTFFCQATFMATLIVQLTYRDTCWFLDHVACHDDSLVLTEHDPLHKLVLGDFSRARFTHLCCLGERVDRLVVQLYVSVTIMIRTLFSFSIYMKEGCVILCSISQIN